MKHPMDKIVKKLDGWDISLTKVAVAATVIIILKLWPAAMTWITNTNIWWFVIALIVCAFRPIKRAYI